MSSNKLVWHTEKRKLRDLIPTEGNPRQMTKEQAEDLQKSLDRFNLVDIPVINTDNRIISGHQRVSILKALNRNGETIDVRVPNRTLTEEEHREYMLRANRNVGQWDFDLLANFDEKILLDVGFDSKELDAVFQLDPSPEDDAVPEVKKTKIKTGDMFRLGEHRLLCGDATKREDVEMLMGKEKADMVFTDPPYGINIVKVGGGGKTKFGKVGGDKKVDGGKWVKANYYRKVINDDKEFAPEFLLEIADKIMIFGGNYFSNRLPNSGCWLCWDKMGENRIHNNFADCEFIWTNFQKPSRVYQCLWRGLLKESGEDLRKRIHPTQKPIKLLVDILGDFTDTGEIVLDCFIGSGSTLIACEKTKCKCFGMEIDPLYCQVIIDRWEKFVGKKAVKIEETRKTSA